MHSSRLISRLCSSLLIGVVALASQARSEVTVLAGATLFDGTGAGPIPDAVVVIRDGRIADIGPAGRVAIPAGSVLPPEAP